MYHIHRSLIFHTCLSISKIPYLSHLLIYYVLSTTSACLSTISLCIISIDPLHLTLAYLYPRYLTLYLTPPYLLSTIYHFCLSIYNLSKYRIHKSLISLTFLSISKIPHFSHLPMHYVLSTTSACLSSISLCIISVDTIHTDFDRYLKSHTCVSGHLAHDPMYLATA